MYYTTLPVTIFSIHCQKFCGNEPSVEPSVLPRPIEHHAVQVYRGRTVGAGRRLSEAPPPLCLSRSRLGERPRWYLPLARINAAARSLTETACPRPGRVPVPDLFSTRTRAFKQLTLTETTNPTETCVLALALPRPAPRRARRVP